MIDIFTPFVSIPIADFEQVNDRWAENATPTG